MALAKTVKFGDFIVQVGDGASPEVFSAPCGLTSRGINKSASTNEQTVPDCADEDGAAWTARSTDALSAEISGSGVMDRDAYALWNEWFESAEARNVRVVVVGNLAAGGGHHAGAFILTAFNSTGERGQRVNVEVTLSSDGAVLWVPAAA